MQVAPVARALLPAASTCRVPASPRPWVPAPRHFCHHNVRETMHLRKLLRLLRRAVTQTFYDNCFDLAKSAAYSSILSFFPGLMVLTALLFRNNVSTVVDEISVALDRVLPAEAYKVAAVYLTAQGKRTQGLLAGACLVAIWSASNVMIALMEGFRIIYRIPTGRSILRA